MSSPQVAVFEQLGPAPAEDLSEKKQVSGTISAPLDAEDSQSHGGQQKSCRTTSIFAVAGCVSRDGPLRLWGRIITG